MRYRRFTLFAVALLVGLSLIPECFAAGEKKPARDAAVATTNDGDVTGHVYDAVSQLPVPGAQVTVAQNGVFPEKGAATGTTNELGLYRCRAGLGRISTSYSIAGILFGIGHASTQTKRIDTTQLPVRVVAPGYRAFEAVVHCRILDAGRFAVALEPILLTPKDSLEAPTAADGWGSLKLLALEVEPKLIHPGEKAKVIAKVEGPAAAAVRGKAPFFKALFGGRGKAPLKLRIYSSLSPKWRGLDIVSSDDGVITFSGEFAAPKEVRSPSVTLYVDVEESPVEILAGASSRRALIQVLPKGADEQAARLRLEAAALVEAGETTQAQAKLVELCARPDATMDDCLWLAAASERIHDAPTQVKATKQALSLLPTGQKRVVLEGEELKPEEAQWRLTTAYARALVANGQMADVLSQVKPEVDKVKEKDRRRTVPGPAMIAIGRAYLGTGKLTEAVSLRDSLYSWPQALRAPEAREFVRQLRLAEAEEATRKTPESSGAWADYGRALMDEGRWEEAIVKLQTALQRDPSAPAVRRDLTYARMHLQDSSTSVEGSLDEAIDAAHWQLGLGKGQTPSRNFHDWHAYAMLLYRKAYAQRKAGHPDAAATLQRAREAIVEAIKNGRQGSDEQIETYYGGGFLFAMSDRFIAIAGFAYPEAAADLVLLDCLDVLASHPEDYLSWHMQGLALLDLQQTEPAAEALAECARLQPAFPENAFAQALLALQREDRAGAMEALREALKVNPHHPQANTLLARLYAEEGDMANSAACLGAHAQFYGETQ